MLIHIITTAHVAFKDTKVVFDLYQNVPMTCPAFPCSVIVAEEVVVKVQELVVSCGVGNFYAFGAAEPAL